MNRAIWYIPLMILLTSLANTGVVFAAVIQTEGFETEGDYGTRFTMSGRFYNSVDDYFSPGTADTFNVNNALIGITGTKLLAFEDGTNGGFGLY